ncbi:hypothetical protein EOL73_03210 [Candidatus Saccharibacteria bacterium]|nr:hypothetical protein [Candidatus Saccharibacteria bacterium]NCU40738.1 hypothetical protein [Candidatus Saccharibacteria bacterium]
MKNLKKKAAAIGAAALISIGLTTAAAPPANAFSTIEMHQACRFDNFGHNQGSWLWSAELTYPSQGVYGWRCYYDNGLPSPRYSMKVQLICDNIYGGSARFTNQSDAYSWYCG